MSKPASGMRGIIQRILQSKGLTALAGLWLLIVCGAAYNGAFFGLEMMKVFLLPVILVGAFTVIVVAWIHLGPGEGVTLWWVRQNREALLRGSAQLNARPIRLDDEVVAYTWTVSFLLFSLRRQTDFYHPGIHDEARVRRAANLCTYLFGFWMIPFGIIWSIDGLAINRKGGVRLRVRELVEASSQPVFRIW